MQVPIIRSPALKLPPVLACALLVGCLTPISKGYEIHTTDLTCDEANRQAYAAVTDMGMTVSAFLPAKPGSPGTISASRSDARGRLGGDVEIRCDGDKVSIVGNETGGFLGDKEFERGVFLGVAGRAGLEVVREGRYATGVMKRRAPSPGAPSAASAATGTAEAPAPSGSANDGASSTAPPTGGLTVAMEPLEGFAAILDFDADLSAGGVLPVKVSIANGTKRAYDFDPSTIAMRRRGSRDQVQPLAPAAAHGQLTAAAARGVQLGDVASAGRVLRDKALDGARLAPGARRTGFVYYPVGDYDHARLVMTDTATGESEGFAVDF